MSIFNVSSVIKNIKTSASIAIRAKAVELNKQGGNVISFATGEPDFDTPENIKKAAEHAIKIGFTKYTAVDGIYDLRKAISHKLKIDNNLVYSANEIIVSNGAKQALYNTLRTICNPGDHVIVPTPCWVTYPEQIKLTGAIPIFTCGNESNNFKLTINELKKKTTKKTRGMIINNPSNPAGAVYSKRDLEELSEFALEKNMWIISDEIYEKLVYHNKKHISIASISPEIKNLVITINGLSKSYAMTGWRVGYAAGAKEIIKSMKKLQGHTTANINSITQKAAIEALTGPQDFIDLMLTEYYSRKNKMLEYFNSLERVSCNNPDGAFYVFPNVSKLYGAKYEKGILVNDFDIANYLLEYAHIAVVPGSSYNCSGYIRLSYATSMENIEKGLERMSIALQNLVF